MAATTPAAVRQALTTRLAALSPATTYSQSLSAAAWRQAYMPRALDLAQESAIRSHLAFFFDDSEVETSDYSRLNPGEGADIATPLTLRFLFRIQPKQMVTTWDAASTAALAAVQWLLAYNASQADFQVFVAPSNSLFILREEISPEWLLVSVELQAQYCIDLTVPS